VFYLILIVLLELNQSLLNPLGEGKCWQGKWLPSLLFKTGGCAQLECYKWDCTDNVLEHSKQLVVFCVLKLNSLYCYLRKLNCVA
jgi:hypothetical protein